MREILTKHKIVLFQVLSIMFLMIGISLIGLLESGVALLSYVVLFGTLITMSYSIRTIEDAKKKSVYIVVLTALILVSQTATFLQPFILVTPFYYSIFKVMEASFANELLNRITARITI